MSPIPDFVVEIRKKIGHAPLWLPGVTAVITRADQVLLVKRSDNGRWTPVTGIPEPGEEPAVAAAREAMEETGVRIRVDRLVSTAVHGEIVHVNGDRATYLDLTFACTWLEGAAHVSDDESSDVRWWPLAALPEMSDVMLTRIEAALSEEREARFVAPAAQAAGAAETRPVPLVPPAPVLGVDACSTGWVGVLLDRDLRAQVFVARTITELVDLVDETSRVAVVAIDIPIGLPDTTGRAADAEARRVLVGKSSSIFSTPTRAALEAGTYAEGREANLAATDGATSVSAQAYALREKVLQVDAWVRSGPQPGVRVVEVHPELSFTRMAGAPVLASKKDPEGVTARREALAAHGITAPAFFRGAGFGEDDLLDACAAAWSAVRHSLGVAESYPEQPEVFSDGIPAAIWA